MKRVLPLLCLAACGPDPFVAVEEAWLGDWKVTSAWEGEGCDEPTTAAVDPYTDMTLTFIAPDGLFLQALGCRGQVCDELPWMTMPLDEATETELSGVYLSALFLVNGDNEGQCDASWARLQGDIGADGVMRMVLRRGVEEAPVSNYDACDAFAESLIDGQCSDTLVFDMER